MVRVRIADDYIGQLFITESGFGEEYDLPDDQVAKVRAAFDAFDEAQEILSGAERILPPPPPLPGNPLLHLERGQRTLYDGMTLYAAILPFPFALETAPLWFWAA